MAATLGCACPGCVAWRNSYAISGGAVVPQFSPHVAATGHANSLGAANWPSPPPSAPPVEPAQPEPKGPISVDFAPLYDSHVGCSPDNAVTWGCWHEPGAKCPCSCHKRDAQSAEEPSVLAKALEHIYAWASQRNRANRRALLYKIEQEALMVLGKPEQVRRSDHSATIRSIAEAVKAIVSGAAWS